MIRNYEACFLISADLSDEQVAGEVKFVEDAISNAGGELVKSEVWGKRTLAYPIKKKNEAVYAFFYFRGEPSLIVRLKDACALRETILRFLFLQRKTLPDASTHDGKPQ